MLSQSSEQPGSKKSSQRPKRFPMFRNVRVMLQMDSMQRKSVYISNVQSVCRQHFLQFGHNVKLQLRVESTKIASKRIFHSRLAFHAKIASKHLDKALCIVSSDMPEINISTLATWILQCHPHWVPEHLRWLSLKRKRTGHSASKAAPAVGPLSHHPVYPNTPLLILSEWAHF